MCDHDIDPGIFKREKKVLEVRGNSNTDIGGGDSKPKPPFIR
jgi:hypothetical protein